MGKSFKRNDRRVTDFRDRERQKNKADKYMTKMRGEQFLECQNRDWNKPFNSIVDVDSV